MMGLTMVQRQAVTKTNATRYKRADKAGKGLILLHKDSPVRVNESHSQRVSRRSLAR